MTVVEYLIDKFDTILPLDFNWDKLEKVFEKAKEMERKQIIDAHDMGYIDGGNHKKVTAEMYYTSIYGSKGSETKQ